MTALFVTRNEKVISSTDACRPLGGDGSSQVIVGRHGGQEIGILVDGLPLFHIVKSY